MIVVKTFILLLVILSVAGYRDYQGQQKVNNLVIENMQQTIQLMSKQYCQTTNEAVKQVIFKRISTYRYVKAQKEKEIQRLTNLNVAQNQDLIVQIENFKTNPIVDIQSVPQAELSLANTITIHTKTMTGQTFQFLMDQNENFLLLKSKLSQKIGLSQSALSFTVANKEIVQEKSFKQNEIDQNDIINVKWEINYQTAEIVCQ